MRASANNIYRNTLKLPLIVQNFCACLKVLNWENLMRVGCFFKVFLLFCLSWLGLATPSFAQDPLKPILDWQKRLTVQDRLTSFGDDLMGDSIDPHLGSLVFEHTDVILPGNNALDVSVRRRLTQGYKYDEGVNVEFGDWELVVPKITAIALTQYGWAGQRCSGDWAQNFPPNNNAQRHSIAAVIWTALVSPFLGRGVRPY